MNISTSNDKNKRSSEQLELDPEFARTLQDFSACVRAWSDVELTLPRTVVHARRRLWRLAVSWAMAVVVAVGAISGGVYQAHYRRQEAARIAAAQAAEQQRLAAQKAQEEDELLAMVDSDVSRQTPLALEPLTQMSNEDSK